MSISSRWRSIFRLIRSSSWWWSMRDRIFRSCWGNRKNWIRREWGVMPNRLLMLWYISKKWGLCIEILNLRTFYYKKILLRFAISALQRRWALLRNFSNRSRARLCILLQKYSMKSHILTKLMCGRWESSYFSWQPEEHLLWLPPSRCSSLRSYTSL